MQYFQSSSSFCTGLLSTFIPATFAPTIRLNCVPTTLPSTEFSPSLPWRRNSQSLSLWYLLRCVKSLLLLIACTKQIFDFFFILILNFAKIKEPFEFTKRIFRSVSWLIISILRISLTCTVFWPISTSAEGS